MAHSNLIFSPPFATNWGFPKKSPSFDTTVQTPKSKRGEIRYSAQPYPIWSWDWPVNFMRGGEQVSGSDYQYLLGFFLQMGGMLSDFLYQDPYDNAVSMQSFGTGDGTTTQFQLTRSIGLGTDIVQNLNGTPSIYLNGAQCGNLLLNSGFESNAGGTPLNTPLAPGAACGDDWTVQGLTGTWVAELEREGLSHSGLNCLLLRIPPGSINSSGTPSATILSSPVPVVPGQMISYGGYTSWDSAVAIPSGVTILQRIAVSFFNASGALIVSDYPGDISNSPNDGIYSLGQAGTVAAPSGAASARLLCGGYVTAGSGTASGLCADLRFDDCYLDIYPYTVGPTGIVTFGSAPTAAAGLTWTGSYYYRVRFDSDTQDFEQFMDLLWTIGSLKLKSVIL